ncbi:MAG TPA: uroporphyrinogen-III C-methyltransferase, partial [Vicinamibacterales bacterium]|nr:uroporphyrinogen-III C-methyltransferase [Vicinamibacterales bacterium]
SISTDGEAPALARVLREALERLVGRNVEDWAALAAKLRVEWRRDGVPLEQRRDALLDALAGLRPPSPPAISVPSRDLRAYQRVPSLPAGTEVFKGDGGHWRGRKPFVSLVGAGPGDPELLTRFAARRLAEADLVLYDALVSPATVSLATRAQKVMVGRRRGSEPIGQEAFNHTLVRAARRGRRVVRLKGGDPFLFGRGGEEALALARAGIPFEIVPGVSSALAAPAAASIPLTHRGVSSAVLVASGHDIGRFQSLVSGLVPGTATLVVLMGTMQRAELEEALVDAGWAPTTPAAIIWNASCRDEAIWTGPLDRLTTSVGPPDAAGTIVIGEVVSFRDVLLLADQEVAGRCMASEVRHA